MDSNFVDLHTHRCTPETEIRRICAYLLGRDQPLPQGVFTAGVHPWDTGRVSEDVLRFFDAPPVGLIGIGEIGLDFSLPDTNRTLQAQWFEKQLAVAEKLKLPVVLHCVKAYNEIQVILRKYNLKAVVFHGFTGSSELAKQLTDSDYYLSFGLGIKKSPKTLKALEGVPFNRFFLETDDYPQVDIRDLYADAAERKGVSVKELQKVISGNYSRIF